MLETQIKVMCHVTGAEISGSVDPTTEHGEGEVAQQDTGDRNEEDAEQQQATVSSEAANDDLAQGLFFASAF